MTNHGKKVSIDLAKSLTIALPDSDSDEQPNLTSSQRL